MLPTFADPKTDFVFKRIFGAEAHKDLLIALLNHLLELEGEHRILEVQHLSLEQHLAVPELKLSIVDVKCTDASSRRFVVEMQTLTVEGFDRHVDRRRRDDPREHRDVLGLCCDRSLAPSRRDGDFRRRGDQPFMRASDPWWCMMSSSACDPYLPSSYAYGWNVSHEAGRVVLWHEGRVDGFTSRCKSDPSRRSIRRR